MLRSLYVKRKQERNELKPIETKFPQRYARRPFNKSSLASFNFPAKYVEPPVSG